MRLTCLHCLSHPVSRPRGLCWSCYHRPEIKSQYPPKGRFGQYGSDGHTHTEPTEEELDALIAEQSKPENLPKWWMKDAARLGGGMPDDE